MTDSVCEHYRLLLAVCKEEALPATIVYKQLRGLLERLCHTLLDGEGLHLTDLAARINFAIAKLGLSLSEQNRLHTFRLTTNGILNRKHPVLPDDYRNRLLRDVKTLALFIKRLSGEEIPDELRSLFPQAESAYPIFPPHRDKRIRRMRVCFQEADENYLYVLPLENVSDAPLRVRYNVPGVNDEFAETCRLLWKNAQINLLDVSVDEEGNYIPAFIILEPDYLLDISSLAECFKDYGHHPANYLLARLQPSDNTRALLLGNIANLFLDEWIHAETEPDYVDCMKKAFRAYPIELAACPDLRDKEQERIFFADCKLHFRHIRQVVTNTFKAAGYELDKTDAVLEPSYICEALGLQGRLDYMQRDMSAFIEMKSGKADEYSIRGKIQPKENNKVQMLLYQAVLEYTMNRDHRRVKSYLLYTRYPLLYPAHPSWAMVRRIMNVRNRIVAGEYAVQFHNNLTCTAKYLAAVTPDVLNERGLRNVLWTRYLAPPIHALGERLNSLSSLERNYFYTLYNFIAKELYISKTGDMNAEGGGHAGAASLWLSTLEEKREAGEIMYDLRILENHAADMHKAHLLLERPNHSAVSLSNFREGDAVILYERNADSDNVTNRMVFKGNIERIDSKMVRFRLRARQQNLRLLPAESFYAMEHDYMDTSFRTMFQGLAAFLSANKERRDLLLGQRSPLADERMDEAIAGAADDFSRISLKAQAAKDYFLLVGPPGTGKTSRALRTMVEDFHRDKKQILLLSYTNRAVDEICKSLSAITPAPHYIRIGSELACDERYRPHLIENVLMECSTRMEVVKTMEDCSIFVGTVATLSAKTDLFRLKAFDVAIIDEATQILEPQLLGLLCARREDGGNAIAKFVLIGDHKQLPAVVLQPALASEVYDEELRGIGLCNLKDSLFERLYRKHIGADTPIVPKTSPIAVGDQHPDAQTTSDAALSHVGSSLPKKKKVASWSVQGRFHDMLCKQGRMHVEVARFPNEAFYGGLLESAGRNHQSEELKTVPDSAEDGLAEVLTHRVAFLPSIPVAPTQSCKVNPNEARLAARLAAAIHRQTLARGEEFHPSRTLGIIAPYRSQIALIKKELGALGVDALNEIVVDTVERFQGSERDVIIYSFCVNNVYQLEHLPNLTEENGVLIDRKLNVALTRARKQLFLIGVPHLLQKNAIYARLLSTVQSL